MQSPESAIKSKPMREKRHREEKNVLKEHMYEQYQYARQATLSGNVGSEAEGLDLLRSASDPSTAERPEEDHRGGAENGGRERRGEGDGAGGGARGRGVRRRGSAGEGSDGDHRREEHVQNPRIDRRHSLPRLNERGERDQGLCFAEAEEAVVRVSAEEERERTGSFYSGIRSGEEEVAGGAINQERIIIKIRKFGQEDFVRGAAAPARKLTGWVIISVTANYTAKSSWGPTRVPHCCKFMAADDWSFANTTTWW